MANTKISQLTANTNPNGGEELVYAYNNANGKMTLNTMKTFASSDSQPTLVSGTNIKTINGNSILGSGNLVISGGGGGGTDESFDAIVDASGDGDYTLVSAAIAAGKYNLFVKNGNYTETAAWDPYSNQTSFLRIIGESKAGVQITIPSTITAANKRAIDMRYGSKANFYMENISFNIALSENDLHTFYDDNGGDVMIKNCSFTYTGAYGTVLLDSGSLGDNICLFNCDFVADGASEVRICENDWKAYGCKFNSTAGTLVFAFGGDDCWLYNCSINAYSIAEVSHLHLYHSVMTVSGGTITGDLDLYHVCDSEVYVSSLQSTPSGINIAVASNSVIEVPGYEIGFGITYEGDRGATNCEIKAATVGNPICMMGCTISASTEFDISSNSNVIGCRFINPIGAISMGNSSVFMGNYSSRTFTLTISGHDNIIVGNNIYGATIVDNGTGTQKANNITA